MRPVLNGSLFFASLRLDAAYVPLNASPIGRPVPDEVEIMAHYPPTTEFAEVGRESGWKDRSVAPDVGINAPTGVGIKVTGVGTRKKTEIDKSYRISLHPSVQSLEDQPTYLNWSVDSLLMLDAI